MEELLHQLTTGELNVQTIVIWTALAFVISAVAGSITGMVMGGKDLGKDLAAMMGALYGPTAAVPAVFSALVLLAWLRAGG